MYELAACLGFVCVSANKFRVELKNYVKDDDTQQGVFKVFLDSDECIHKTWCVLRRRQIRRKKKTIAVLPEFDETRI